MKIGDLVKMKPMMFWAAKQNRAIHYTGAPGIVISGRAGPNNPYATISVLIGTQVYRGMASEWELVNGKG